MLARVPAGRLYFFREAWADPVASYRSRPIPQPFDVCRKCAERLALAGMKDMAQKTKSVCISCHDFLANENGANELRTKVEVIAFLKQNGFAVSLRESDERCNVRDYVYGVNQRFLANDRA